jgi:hypothetical protein
MKKTMVILMVLLPILLFSAEKTGALGLSKSLKADSTSLNGSTKYIVDADTYYTGIISLGSIKNGWAYLSCLLEDIDGTASQSVDISFRYYDNVTGFTSDWIDIGTVPQESNTAFYLSNETYWRPSYGLQFRLISTGTGRVKHNINFIYN